MYFGNRLGVVAPLVFVTAATACTGGSTGDAPSSFAPAEGGGERAPTGGSDHMPMIACNPLADVETAIALEDVLGVGKDATGKLYVVDKSKATSNYRVFISSDGAGAGADGAGALQRHDVSGSGSIGGEVDGEITIDVDGTSANPLIIKLERTGGITERMGVLHGSLKETKTFEIGKDGETLTVVNESAVTGLKVKNLPGTILIEYDATTSDNQRIFVTRPKVDWKYEDFRLFIGRAPPEQVAEAHVKSASRGSTTVITFVHEITGTTDQGIEQTAIFPSQLSSDKASLKVGSNKTLSMTVDPEPKLDGLLFSCINQNY